MTLAWSVPVDTAPERLVLVAYAWRAGAKLIAWPSLDQLVQDTRLYRESISVARRALVCHHSYLADTGQRRGKSGRVAVYRLTLNERQLPPIKPDESAAKAAHSDDEMSGFNRSNERQLPQTIPIIDFEQSMNSSGAQAREHDQGGEAPDPEQIQGSDDLPPPPERGTPEQIARLDALLAQFPNLDKRRTTP
jgi:hypothetical protein